MNTLNHPTIHPLNHRFAVLCLALVCAGATAVRAATTITVTSTADSGPGSLREALASAADGDTIDASSLSGTILLTSGELLVTNSVDILGPGPATLAVDGNFPNTTNRVFRINTNTVVSISGLTITNGHAYIGDGSPADWGGGIYNDHATLTVSNCTLSGNYAGFYGGGIFNDGSRGSSATLTIVNSTLSGNAVEVFGGGIVNDGQSGSATLTIVNSTLSGNEASGGGGIYNTDFGEGGTASVQIINSTISSNSAAGNIGGGIVNDGQSGSVSLTIVNSTLIGNSAINGGGIYNTLGALTIVNSTLSGNSAPNGGGGGISNEGGTLIVKNSALSGNSAASEGGGIRNDGAGIATVTVESSTLSGNSVEFGSGGGIFVEVGDLTISNSTLSGNSAAFGGGGIVNLGTLVINSSIVALNTAPTDPDIAGGPYTGSFNFIGGDPLLGPLQDNGGPTFTHALLPGSPAIDQGKNFSGSATDQRGFARPVDFAAIANAAGGDGSDIGAFEVQTLDSDGDGVRDDLDSCPNTAPGAVVDADGCSIDQLVPCSGPLSSGAWRNHGQYVSRVAKAANQFLAAGLITEEQKGEIVSQAASSHCGKRSTGARNVIATLPPGNPKGNGVPGTGQGSPDNKPLVCCP